MTRSNGTSTQWLCFDHHNDCKNLNMLLKNQDVMERAKLGKTSVRLLKGFEHSNVVGFQIYRGVM